jgi:hypothetical protein
MFKKYTDLNNKNNFRIYAYLLHKISPPIPPLPPIPQGTPQYPPNTFLKTDHEVLLETPVGVNPL